MGIGGADTPDLVVTQDIDKLLSQDLIIGEETHVVRSTNTYVSMSPILKTIRTERQLHPASYSACDHHRLSLTHILGLNSYSGGQINAVAIRPSLVYQPASS